MTTNQEFFAHIRNEEVLRDAVHTTRYIDADDSVEWIVDGKVVGVTSWMPGTETKYALQYETKGTS